MYWQNITPEEFLAIYIMMGCIGLYLVYLLYEDE